MNFELNQKLGIRNLESRASNREQKIHNSRFNLYFLFSFLAGGGKPTYSAGTCRAGTDQFFSIIH